MKRSMKRRILQHGIIVFGLMSMTLVAQIKGMDQELYVNEDTLPQSSDTEYEGGYLVYAGASEALRNVQGTEISEDEDPLRTENLTAEAEESITTLSLTARERYELAKIIMCEAEGEGVITKGLVGITVLNRVLSDNFPDTIHEVIFQESNGIYQFSPVMQGGRWYKVEPNNECYYVVDAILRGEIEDTSDGALYFEDCTDTDNWHSRNLEYLFASEGIRFYK